MSVLLVILEYCAVAVTAIVCVTAFSVSLLWLILVAFAEWCIRHEACDDPASSIAVSDSQESRKAEKAPGA